MEVMILCGMFLSILAIGLDNVPAGLTGGFFMVTGAILYLAEKTNGI